MQCQEEEETDERTKSNREIGNQATKLFLYGSRKNKVPPLMARPLTRGRGGRPGH